MAITTLDGAIAGMRPPETIYKVGVAVEAAGLAHSHFYSTGAPAAAAAPTPGINGAALTTYAGQIPWTNPGSGNSYLARLALSSTVACSVLLCDRLWHNSGLSLTSTSLQSITSGAMPARDKNGATTGADLLCGLEFSAAGGAGTPTCTLTYTNTAGTGSRTATFVGVASPNAGSFFRWPLQAGDTGIQSIQGYQASATWTSGTAHMVVYRVIAQMELSLANTGSAIDALTSGFPRLYDNSVLFLIQIPSATTATNLSGHFIPTQG